VPAVEVMLNSTYVSQLIREGEIHEIKEIMAKGSREGMQTFDQSLYELYKDGKVELGTALDFADSRTDLEWRINFGGGMTGSQKAVDDEALNPLQDFEDLSA
jgi:twitching motility protein PilU